MKWRRHEPPTGPLYCSAAGGYTIRCAMVEETPGEVGRTRYRAAWEFTTASGRLLAHHEYIDALKLIAERRPRKQ